MDTKAIGKQFRAELDDQAAKKAAMLFDGLPADAVKLSDAQFLELVRRNLGDPGFLEGLVVRVGGRKYRETMLQVTGQPESRWPLPGGYVDG